MGLVWMETSTAKGPAHEFGYASQGRQVWMETSTAKGPAHEFGYASQGRQGQWGVYETVWLAIVVWKGN